MSSVLHLSITTLSRVKTLPIYRKYTTSNYEEDATCGWVGVVNGKKRGIYFKGFSETKHEMVPLNVDTTSSVALCRVAWDLGLRSPSGFSSYSSVEPEMGFSVYIEDMLDKELQMCDELPEKIWSELMKKHAIIEDNTHGLGPELK